MRYRLEHYGNGCTAGFEAANGDVGMLAAGHCYTMGEVVPQGYCNPVPFCHDSGNMGKVTIRSQGDYQLDAEFLDATTIGTSLQARVYTSMTNNRNVYTWGWSWVGETVCYDGSVTGENCTGYVSAIEQTIYDGTYHDTHVTKTTSSSQLCWNGDSGGPVYTYGSSGLIAYGLIEARNQDGTTCWYTELGDVLYVLNVSLVTS